MKLRYEYEYRFGSLIRGVRVGVENIMCNDEHGMGYGRRDVNVIVIEMMLFLTSTNEFTL